MIQYSRLEGAGNAIIPRDTAFDGERFDAFAELTRMAKAHGSLVVAQVSHHGRRITENVNTNSISASNVQPDTNTVRPVQSGDGESFHAILITLYLDFMF